MYCCYKHIHCKHVFTQLDKETRCCTKKTLLSLPAKNLNYHLISWEYINQRQRFFFSVIMFYMGMAVESIPALLFLIVFWIHVIVHMQFCIMQLKRMKANKSPSCYKYYTGKYSSHVPIIVYLPKCILKSNDRIPFR